MSAVPAMLPQAQQTTIIQPVSQSLEAQPQVRALVISGRLEVRQGFLRKVERLADVTVCSNRTQAEELLGRQTFDLVFCDEHLPDGSYTDLIARHYEQQTPRIVVLTGDGDWSLYFQAVGKGAIDVMRWSACITDIEVTVIRSLHEQERSTAATKVA
jgi:DNA-binding NtrC family response regulator